MGVLVRPPSTGSRREEDFPSLVTQWPTKVDLRVFHLLHHPLCRSMSADFRPEDVARGFTWNPLTPDRGLNSISPSRYVIDWSVCPTVLLTEISDRETLPYALMLSMQQLAGSRPIVDFIRTLNVKVVAKFFSKLTQNYRDSSIHLHRPIAAMTKRGKRKRPVRGTPRAFHGQGRGGRSSANGRPPPRGGGTPTPSYLRTG